MNDPANPYTIDEGTPVMEAKCQTCNYRLVESPSPSFIDITKPAEKQTWVKMQGREHLCHTNPDRVCRGSHETATRTHAEKVRLCQEALEKLMATDSQR